MDLKRSSKHSRDRSADRPGWGRSLDVASVAGICKGSPNGILSGNCFKLPDCLFDGSLQDVDEYEEIH